MKIQKSHLILGVAKFMRTTLTPVYITSILTDKELL